MTGKERSDTIAAYDEGASRYDASIGALTNYDETYDWFIAALPETGRILDLACGSGVITRRIRAARAQIKITGIDLSEGMLALARCAVPDGTFVQSDICSWRPSESFDGIVIGFGLPYLDPAEVSSLIGRCGNWLVQGGLFYASFMQGARKGYEVPSFSPETPIYIHYHEEASIVSSMSRAGLRVEKTWRLSYAEKDGTTTTDVVLIARKLASA